MHENTWASLREPSPGIFLHICTNAKYYSLEGAGSVARFPVVAVLDLKVVSRELDCMVHCHRMRPVQNGSSRLLVEQIQLDGVAGVDVGVAVEVLSLQEQYFRLHNALLAQSLAVIDPVH